MSFCKEATAVVFILDEAPRDSTTFLMQRNFLKGVLERMTNYRSNMTLLYFDRHQQGEFVFRVAIRDALRKKFTTESLYTRATDIWKVGSAADFFPPFYQSIYYSVQPLIVAIDVRLPHFFYWRGGQFPIPTTETRMGWEIFYKVYEIFTTGQEESFKPQRSFSKPESKGSVDEIDSVEFKDIHTFHYNFEMLYIDLCRVVTVCPDATGEAKHNRVLGCNVSDCSIMLEMNANYEIKYMLEFFHYRWMIILDTIAMEMGWERNGIDTMALQRAKSICQINGMSPLTIRSQSEAKKYATYIEEIFREENLGEVADKNTKMKMAIGLVRRRETAGQRFAWINGKDLTFSFWDEKEPIGGDQRGCGGWEIDFSHYEVGGWSSERCGEKNVKAIILCHDELPQKEETLQMTVDTNIGLDNTGAYTFGEIYSHNYQEGHIITSMSLAISSGFLTQRLLEDLDLRVKGLVYGERVSTRQSMTDDFVSEVGRLFYPCGTKDAPMGVPFSQVCDGVRNCGSGADESICDVSGYPSCSTREFSCASHQCVPLEAKCDMLADCQDGSDEQDCDLDCPHRLCANGRCLPKPWFHDGQIDCSDGFDETAKHADPCIFICNRTRCVTREMLNDGVIDCKGPEGPLDETLGSLESINCPINVTTGYANNWAPRCVLFYDNFGEILGCRDFTHLENCQGFVCPAGYAKCPGYFCIPLAYMSDGKQDCDEGQDEGPQSTNRSIHAFKCHPYKSQYVPLSSVCDGRKDCTQGEDELDCDHTCSPGFICLAGAVSAVRYNKDQAPSDWSFIGRGLRYLDLSGVDVPEVFKLHYGGHFKQVLLLNLSRCGTRDISTGGRSPSDCGTEQRVIGFETLQKLDLSHNKLERVQDCSFISSMISLKELNLAYNENLTEIGSLAFIDLKNLRVMDLSYTAITKLEKLIFSHLTKLETLLLKRTRLTAVDFVLPAFLLHLNIEDTKINSVEKYIFKTLEVEMKDIRSSSYKVCCPEVLGPLVPSHVCHFPADEIVSSCEDLVSELPLRVLLWLVGSATLLGNIVTLFYRLTWDRELLLKPYGLFVTNLGISDILMGVYLAVMAIANARFRSEYVFHDYRWRTGYACWAAGTMVTLSSFTSTLFIFLITVDRFLAVRYPYGDVRFNNRTMMFVVAGAWTFGISVPLLPFANDWVTFSNSGMCLGLPLKSDKLPGWQYSVTLFVGLNFVLFLLIGFGQGVIYKLIKDKANRTRKNLNPQSQLYQNQRMQEIAIAKRLSLVVMSNFVCWFPIIIMGLLTLSGIDVGEAAFRWSAVVILPINSALNPLLYTVPAIKKKLNDYLEARKQGKMAAKRTKKTYVSSNRDSKISCRERIKVLARMNRAFTKTERLRNMTASELASFYRRVIDVRAACAHK